MTTTTTTHYAAIEYSNLTGTVYGIGATPDEAIAEALRQCAPTTDCDGKEVGGRDSYRAVPCTAAAAEYVQRWGGAPDAELTVSHTGVCRREEEGYRLVDSDTTFDLGPATSKQIVASLRDALEYGAGHIFIDETGRVVQERGPGVRRVYVA